MTNIMLDLETLGTRPGSIILAIGAVKFGNGEISSHFYRRIDPSSSTRHGLTMDADTVMWWLKQDEAARIELTKPGEELPAVLAQFTKWMADEKALIWGNGASFDNAMLAEAFARVGIPQPWKFWNDRCYRTVKATRPDLKPREIGTKHNALDDAASQAEHLMKIWASSEH